VDGLLSVAWEKQVEQTTRYVGRGRGSLHREKRVIQNTRYHITHITRQEDIIAARNQRFGWKAFATNSQFAQSTPNILNFKLPVEISPQAQSSQDVLW
jgi:hypothetical protein